MASEAQHYVIVGSGPAGNEAAWNLRERDHDARITMITAAKLLYIRRFDLAKVFGGETDWRNLIVYPPSYYDDKRIQVRRNSRVLNVDPKQQRVTFAHKESLRYDKLLIASGGGGYLPESLREFRGLIHSLGTFEDAIRTKAALNDDGRVIMVGGDMMGVFLARTMVEAGYSVTLVAGAQLFWPHEISVEERPRFVDSLRNMGIDVLEDKFISRIEEGAKGLAARRMVFSDGDDVYGDVVLAFCGLMPTMGFMIGTGLNVQRGLLVSAKMATDNENIWAAGDVCQIFHADENRYRFSHEWKDVQNMGRVAAVNMTGGDESMNSFREGGLTIDENGSLYSSYWDYS